MSALLVAGAVVVVAGAFVAAAGRGLLRPALWTQALGAALLGLGGAWALARGETAGEGFTDGFALALGVDPLSGAFLLALGLVAVPALLYAGDYFRPGPSGRAAGALCGAFVLALAGVLVARDPLTFLLCWEAMTLVPAAMILVARSDETARRTTFVYVSITHLGGAGVWVAILLLADAGALSGGTIETGSSLQIAIVLAALVGFGTKAGLMPLHAWLPRAHPIAPAPASALMSGVMTKVALYGLVRVLLQWVGATPAWVGALVVLLGAASALAGILYAVFQSDLKRLLAFSTIDNVGIVVLGIGAAVALRTEGDVTWAALALAAALLHVLTHAAAKGLLFLAAGSLERAVGGLDLDRLGGLLRRLPWTGGALLVGCASIAGVPPFGGFASEWATLQALVHLPASGDVLTGTVGAIALGALGAAAAVAALAFVKVAGMALFGPPPRTACATAVEPSGRAMRLAPALLAAACLVLGLVPGVLFAWLAAVLPGAEAPAVRPGLDLPTTGDLPTPGIAVWLLVLTATLALLRGRHVAAPAPTWASGQPLDGGLWWTGAGFTKSLRLVLEAVLRPEREVTVELRGGVVQQVSYRGRVPHLLDERVYRPVTAGALAAAGVARRLQSGRLGSYVVYLVLLVLALLLGVRLEVIG